LWALLVRRALNDDVKHPALFKIGRKILIVPSLAVHPLSLGIHSGPERPLNCFLVILRLGKLNSEERFCSPIGRVSCSAATARLKHTTSIPDIIFHGQNPIWLSCNRLIVGDSSV
jgi:hypothetical protein